MKANTALSYAIYTRVIIKILIEKENGTSVFWYEINNRPSG